MDPEDNLSIMDRVKLKRARSTELRIIQQALEEEDKVARLKMRLEKRQARTERRRSELARMQTGNEHLVVMRTECSEDSEDNKKSVNFNSQLTKIKSLSPVESTAVSTLIDSDQMTESTVFINESQDVQGIVSDTEQMFSPTQHTSPQLRRRGRRRSRLSPADQVQVIKSPEPEHLGVAEAARDISSSLVDSEFRLPNNFTPRRPKKRLDDEDSSLFGPTQLVDLINHESQLPTTPLTSKRRKLEVNVAAESTTLLMGRFNDISALCFLNESSVRFSFFVDKCLQAEVGPFKLKRIFKDPFLIFTADRISVKEFVSEGTKIIEHSFSVLCDSGIVNDVVISSTEFTVFIKESQDVQGIVSTKLSDTEVMVCHHHVSNNSHGTLVTYTNEDVTVQHVASVPGCVQHIVKVRGCDNLVIFIVSKKLYLWNLKRRKCLKVIKTNVKPCVVGAMFSSRGNILLWQNSNESSLVFSVLTSSGIRGLKDIPVNEEIEKIQLLDVKKEKFSFLSGDKLLILTWTESEKPKLDVIEKFDTFPLP